MTDIDRNLGLERNGSQRLLLFIAAIIGGALAAFGFAFAFSPLAVLSAIIGLAFMAATFVRPL